MSSSEAGDGNRTRPKSLEGSCATTTLRPRADSATNDIGARGCWEILDLGNPWSMQIPGVHIETLHNPVRYTYAQIEKACAIAQMLNRGKLVLVEPPQR